MYTIYGNIIRLFKEIYIFRAHFAESADSPALHCVLFVKGTRHEIYWYGKKDRRPRKNRYSD